MAKYSIDLSTLTPHGEAHITRENGVACLSTARSVTDYLVNLRGDCNRRHYASLAGHYRLPLRIDMSISLDFSILLLFVGDGHILFGSLEHNRKIEDIAKPSGKPNQDHTAFQNDLPRGVFTDISVIYHLDEMQILIDGEERFYSRKQAYMRAKEFPVRNAEGFELGFAVAKGATLCIRELAVTELGAPAPLERAGAAPLQSRPMQAEPEKPTFEGILAKLPPDIREEMLQTDGFLKALRPLKFKRTIDKSGGKITYVAPDCGVSYAFHISQGELAHHFGWYIVYNGKPETWHRRADYMEETLAEIAKTDAPLALRIFYALNDCIACYGLGCLAKTLYAFGDERRLACHGRVMLRMCAEDFEDARAFFRHLNALMAQKMAQGLISQEKLYLKKRPSE